MKHQFRSGGHLCIYIWWCIGVPQLLSVPYLHQRFVADMGEFMASLMSGLSRSSREILMILISWDLRRYLKIVADDRSSRKRLKDNI